MLGEKIKVCGQVVSYLFENESNNYRVARIKTDKGAKLTIVGYFPHLEEGLNYEFVGEIRKHINYGEQLAVDTYARLNSFSITGLVEYLSSDKFFGIGKKLAESIVDTLGTNCLNDIMENPDILDKVPKLTKDKKDTIVHMIKENYESERTYIRLYEFGLSNKMIERLISFYGLDAANVVEKDPYQLIYDIEGFGFKRSDELAKKMGISDDDKRRIKASIVYTLNNVCFQYGFTYLTYEQLFSSAKALIASDTISDELYKEAIEKLVEDKRIIAEDNRYFDSYLYNAEKKVAKRIKAIYGMSPNYKRDEVIANLKYVEDLIKIDYTPSQKDAIINALSSRLSIITGGPGTGKSTIIKGLIHVYAKMVGISLSDDAAQDKILLAAPTGRAAKRMSEITHFKAMTIHKALGFNPLGTFNFDSDNKLPYSLVIIDEVSMLDVSLAATLFDALANNVILIFVGDENQLPSVGPGNVLHDIISSNYFKVSRLNQIMRQAIDSNIIKLSLMIQSEEIDFRLFALKKEVFFYNSDTKRLADHIFKILDKFIETGGDMFSEIQILIPMYAGVGGIDAINAAIQERYNKEDKMIIRDDKKFKVGDKVLQLKNDGKLDIMNGDIGRIIEIAKIGDTDVMMINFDGKIINYPLAHLEDLTLAYAISIHKSQGNEFDNVILPILPSYGRMMRKKLIYTAVTRAKKKLIILGETKTLAESLKKGEYLRQTALGIFLNSILEEDQLIINDKDIPFDTLGEYMMEGITPYSFMEDK